MSKVSGDICVKVSGEIITSERGNYYQSKRKMIRRSEPKNYGQSEQGIFYQNERGMLHGEMQSFQTNEIIRTWEKKRYTSKHLISRLGRLNLFESLKELVI